MRTSHREALDRASPVERLAGIGKKRAETLARRDVYSIDDFLASTASEEQRVDLAAALGLKIDALEAMRAGALSLPGESRRRTGWTLVVAGVVVAVVAVALVGGAMWIIGTSFHIPYFGNLRVVIVENETPGSRAYSWKVNAVTVMSEPGVFATTLSVSPVFDEAFTHELPRSLPDGVLLAGLPERTRIKSVASELLVSDVRQVEVSPGWVRNAEVGTTSQRLRVEAVKLMETETLSGRNVLFRLSGAALDLPPAGRKVATMRFAAELEDVAAATVMDRVRGGVVSVWFRCSGTEALVGPPMPIRFGGVRLPVSRRRFESSDRTVTVECTWRSAVPGHFESPDEMRGAKQFWDSTTAEPITGNFAFRVDGAQWLPYVIQIVGWPLLVVGLGLARKGRTASYRT